MTCASSLERSIFPNRIYIYAETYRSERDGFHHEQVGEDGAPFVAESAKPNSLLSRGSRFVRRSSQCKADEADVKPTRLARTPARLERSQR